MNLLRFLMRVAFICNGCFLLAMGMLWLPRPPQGEILSLIIILGYVVAVILNGVVNVWLAVLLLAGKKPMAIFPSWLMRTNFIFFLIQLVVILK